MLLGLKNLYVYLFHNSSKVRGVQVDSEVLLHAICHESRFLPSYCSFILYTGVNKLWPQGQIWSSASFHKVLLEDTYAH